MSKEEPVSELCSLAADCESLKSRLEHAEEMVRLSEERQRTLLDNPIVAVGLSDGNQVLYANRLLLELFGYSDLNEFLSLPLIDHVAESSRALIRDRMEKGAVGIPSDPTFVYDIIRKDGSVRTVEINVVPYQWKGNNCRLSLFRDITERRLVEEAFRESERKYRALVETTGTGYVILDSEGRVLDANQEYVRLVGCEMLSEILGRSVVEWTAQHDKARNAEEVKKCLERGFVRNLEIDYVNAGGKFTPIEINATVMQTAEGTRIVTLCHDISERKRLEAQLLQSQKMESIGVLAGGVAHDFNNLLSVINGYSEMLLDDMGPDWPGSEDLEQIKQAGQHAASLTSQLLAFSRRHLFQPEIINLNEAVSNTGKILRRIIGENIVLTILAHPDLGLVKADSGQIEQVIMNLAVNSRDAMPEGGRLIIETANVFLDESNIRESQGISAGPYVMLAVSDSGTGIDCETQPHIFEPFFTTKGVGKGTGLGLSTVYGIIKQSGGFIEVHSEAGQGTAFKIFLPQAPSEADCSNDANKDVAGFSGTETVLLVEDDASLRRLAARVLSNKGYRVIEAVNGKDALHKTHAYDGTIHLLLTDIMMPEMNGFELAVRIRQERPAIKTLFVSGYAGEDILDHSLYDSNTTLLLKPFTPSSLARTVRETIDADNGHEN